MDTLTRRKFLSMTAGVVAASAAAPVLRLSEIAEAAINRPLPSGTPILVLVTLYG
ncbi:MAG: twin-arginine translocation signal domain-containing protein, partial [Actinobacteria bacterium]|nr:twin-arginine translocation signal domain-containing protein [Actinomycetota bacterium]